MPVEVRAEVVEIADADTIYRNPREPYTQRLLSAIPKGWHGEHAGVAGV